MTTVNPKIIGFYERTGNLWWSQYRIHFYQNWNNVRVPYIGNSIVGERRFKSEKLPLNGLRLVEIGCGGGHLTEALGRLGAQVVGIDPVKINIDIAEEHLAEQEAHVRKNVSYETITLEDFVDNPSNRAAYDGVIVSEVFEHLDYNGVKSFIEISNKLLKVGGSLVITMIAPNFWLKRPYQFFLKRLMTVSHADLPDYYALPNQEMQKLMKSNHFKVVKVQGFMFNPFTFTHYLSSLLWFKYGIHATKMK